MLDDVCGVRGDVRTIVRSRTSSRSFSQKTRWGRQARQEAGGGGAKRGSAPKSSPSPAASWGPASSFFPPSPLQPTSLIQSFLEGIFDGRVSQQNLPAVLSDGQESCTR